MSKKNEAVQPTLPFDEELSANIKADRDSNNYIVFKEDKLRGWIVYVPKTELEKIGNPEDAEIILRPR